MADDGGHEGRHEVMVVVDFDFDFIAGLAGRASMGNGVSGIIVARDADSDSGGSALKARGGIASQGDNAPFAGSGLAIAIRSACDSIARPLAGGVLYSDPRFEEATEIDDTEYQGEEDDSYERELDQSLPLVTGDGVSQTA
jgi:hypothetical protein